MRARILKKTEPREKKERTKLENRGIHGVNFLGEGVYEGEVYVS